MPKPCANPLQEMNLQPIYDQELETVWQWLNQHQLVAAGGTMDVAPGGLPEGETYDGASVVIAEATQRSPVRHNTQDELKSIKERFKDAVPEGVTPESVWGAVQDPRARVRKLDWQRLPADAMAFYRPFHYPPFDQWGIYLLVGPLLSYFHRLQSISAGLRLYSPEVLMHLVLFEIFNHEFFHHLTESAATNLEILAAAQGKPRPVYLDYRQQQRLDGFGYPHAPLEEALANAYAFNALSFICRIKVGYKTAVVRTYQAAIAQHWHLEPPGYRDAACYVNGQYVPGGAHLLAQLLGSPDAANLAPLSSLAKHLMPNGFTALMQKPDIPTYLVGSSSEIEQFHKLVPAPNEAYTQLFWPYNTSHLDQYVREKKEEEKRKRKQEKQARDSSSQDDLFN
jgi:hypothetical protein